MIFSQMSSTLQTLIFSFVLFVFTTAGGATIFLFKSVNKKVIAFTNAFASGVMIASSIFSLLLPSIDFSEQLGYKAYIILPICFIFSGLTIYLLYKTLNNSKKSSYTPQNKNKMLFLSVTLHNIPEGMCVGVSFASIMASSSPDVSLMSSIMLAIGIAIQNFPEGSTISFPLHAGGYTKKKSFLFAVMSGFVEIPAAIIACLLASISLAILPIFLSFAAGIMIIVACLELCPEAVENNKSVAIIGLTVGLTLMMILDLALG